MSRLKLGLGLTLRVRGGEGLATCRTIFHFISGRQMDNFRIVIIQGGLVTGKMQDRDFEGRCETISTAPCAVPVFLI